MSEHGLPDAGAFGAAFEDFVLARPAGDGDGGAQGPPFGSMGHALGAAGLPMPDFYDLEE